MRKVYANIVQMYTSCLWFVVALCHLFQAHRSFHHNHENIRNYFHILVAEQLIWRIFDVTFRSQTLGLLRDYQPATKLSERIHATFQIFDTFFV